MKILILGSAPNAKIPAADHVYCANTSAYYYADRLKGISKIDCVVGSHIVCASPQSEARDELKKLRSYLNNSPISGLIVLDHNPWYLGWDLSTRLMRVNHDTGLVSQVISSAERSDVLFKTAGLREPILSHSLIREINSPRQAWWGAKLLFQSLTHRFRKRREISPVLTPSTGLWAAMIAMERHGPDAEYIISGISLTTTNERIPHPDGLRPGNFPKLTHHLQADRKIVEKLKNSYIIQYITPGEHS